MTENSTGHGLRSRARRQSTLTREAIEEVLYDKAYSWKLVPGSDVMATTVGVLPKIFTYENGAHVYAGLVTIDRPVTVDEAHSNQGWQLTPADAPMTEATYDGPWPLSGGEPAGVYLGWYGPQVGDPPPYAFPEGWTPGNTTGSGPVLPSLGASSGGSVIWAGLVDYDGVSDANPDASLHGWWLTETATPLTANDVGDSAPAPDGTPAGAYLAAYYSQVQNGDTAGPPTALPAGWTFRPYGLGPIAITDENAGGLIGDVAYVVSGYVYNYDEAGGKLYGNWRGVLGNGVYDMQVGDTFVVRNFAADRMQLVSVAGAITVTGAGGSAAVTPDDTAEFSIRSSELGYWPFIERFDLANKKWLPRVPLPQLSIPAAIFGAPWDVAANYHSGSTLQHNSHMWTANADTAAGDEPGVSPKWDMTDPPAALKPFASEGGIAGVIDGKLYFGGGDSDDITGQEFFCYDPADDSITRLADMEGDGWYADYSAYGVVGGKLWYCNSGASEGGNDMRCYDPATDEWTLVAVTGARTLDYYAPDQVQGFEIDGKLWFVHNGKASVFDPVALTVTAKATWAPNASGEGTLPFYIDGKIVEFASPRSTDTRSSSYDPAHDTWAEHPADVFKIPSRADAEFASITYNGVPYLLSNVTLPSDPPSNSPNSAGIYGYTGVTPSRPFTGLVTAQRIAAAQAAAIREAKPITFSVGPCTFALASNTQRAVFEAEMHIPENHVITAQVHESVAFGGVLISVYRLNADGSFAGTGSGYTAIFDHGTALVDLWPVGLFTSALSAESSYDDLITDPDNPGYVKNVGAGGLFHVRLEVLNLRRI